MRTARLACLLAVIGGAHSLRAEETAPAPSLETVVTAARWDEPVTRSDRAIESISEEDLVERAIATTPEAVEEAAGVYLQRTNLGGGSPFVRGLTGARVLLLVDGVRLNDGTVRSGPNQYLNTVDPFLLQRVEVLRGPASVLHGSDAIGGVVQVLTAAPRYFPQGFGVRGRLVGQLTTWTREKSAHGRVETGSPRAAVLLAASYRDFDDLVTPSGRVPYTGYHEADFAGRGVAAVGPGRLEIGWQSVRQMNVPRTDRCPSAADLAAAPAAPLDCRFFDEQFRDSVVVTYRGGRGRVEDLQVRAHYQARHELRERIREDRGLVERELDEVVTPGMSAQLRARVHESVTVTAGADVHQDRVRSRAESRSSADDSVSPADRGRYPDGSSHAMGAVFALAHLELGTLARLWTGGRLTAVRVRATDPQFGDVRADALSPVGAAGARLLPEGPVQLLLAVNQGFRAPSLDDVGALGEFGGGYDVPNPDLTPEHAVGYEAGVRGALGPLEMEAFVWRTDLRDAILRRPSTLDGEETVDIGGRSLPVFARANVGRARVFGAEAGLRWRLPWGLTARAAGMIARGDEQTPEVAPLSRVPPATLRAGLRWEHPGGRASFEALLVAAGPQRRLAARDLTDERICPDGPEDCDGTDGYLVLRLRAGYRITDAIRMDLHARNLTNTTYRAHGSGIDGPAAGVGLRLTAEL